MTFLEVSDTFLNIYGWMAVAVAVVLMSSQLVDARHVFMKKTLGGLSPIPYMTMLARSSTYIPFGLSLGVLQVWSLACFGVVCATLTLGVLHHYTERSQRGLFQGRLLMLLGPYYLCAVLIFLFVDSHNTLQWYSTLSLVASFGPYLAPGSKVIKIIKEKKGADAISPIFLAFVFVEALVWTMYGFMLDSVTVWGPCAVGNVICLASVYACTKYRGKEEEEKVYIVMAEVLGPVLPAIAATKVDKAVTAEAADIAVMHARADPPGYSSVCPLEVEV